MKRLYDKLIAEHFKHNSQMAFITGPRQVGKTTSCRAYKKNHIYVNWDNDDDRLLILQGPKNFMNKLNPFHGAVIVFDELHKYSNWKNFIKGFYDTYAKDHFRIIITGSAKFDIYRKGADSLMGRYFHYRMYPLSTAELVRTKFPQKEIHPPRKIQDKIFKNLIKFGGFPEPFIKRNTNFFNKWKHLRKQLLFREDLRDLTKIHEIRQVEILAELLVYQAGGLCNYTSLARKIRSSENSIRSWIRALELLYFCFSIRPWKNNISRSILKEPKIYLWDWSLLQDEGPKYENFVALHLFKAVSWWQDNGFGEYGLYYLRTKEKREVDFLVAKNKKPWFLVETKTSREKISKSLVYFQKKTNVPHAFQVTINEEYINKNCFDISYPVVVPATTFLSQLV